MESGPWSSEAGRWRDRGHWSHHLPAPSLASRYLCLDRGHGSHHLPAASLAGRYLCLDRGHWSHHLPTSSAASRYLCLDPDTNPELFSLSVQICIRIQASLAIGPGIFLTGNMLVNFAKLLPHVCQAFETCGKSLATLISFGKLY